MAAGPENEERTGSNAAEKWLQKARKLLMALSVSGRGGSEGRRLVRYGVQPWATSLTSP